MTVVNNVTTIATVSKWDVMRKPKKPKVYYTYRAWLKLRYLVEKCSSEVGWFGVVEQIDDLTYVICDVIAPKQKASGGSFEYESEDAVKCFDKLIETGAMKTDGSQSVNNLGHSHVRMGTSPSSTDDDQMMDFYEEGRDYMIQDIHNKQGEITVNIFDFKNKILHEKVDTEVVYPALSEEDTEDLDAQLEEVTYPTIVGHGSSYYANRKWDYKKKKFVTIGDDDDDDDYFYTTKWSSKLKSYVPVGYDEDSDYLGYGDAPTLDRSKVLQLPD